MDHRTRLITYVHGEKVDRPPFWLFWDPWETTWQRWRQEGLPMEIQDWRDVISLFGADPLPYNSVVPVNLGPCPPIQQTLLREDEKSITFIDEWGVTRRDLKTGMSMSEFIKFPVNNHEEWVQFRDAYLDPDDPRRLDSNWREQCRAWTEMGLPIQLGLWPNAGIFGPVRMLMGNEGSLMAFVTMPELVHEVMDHLTSIYLTVFEKVVKEVQADIIDLWEDICFHKGPLFSPKTWEEFMGPCYRRIKAFADRHNIPIISVDTDGNPDRLISAMMQGGVNLLYPMEVAAGCDVNAFQQKYPALCFMGGIDKRALAQGPDAINRELERVRPAIRHGRYIADLDHMVPDDVSWENYSYYARALRRMVYSG